MELYFRCDSGFQMQFGMGRKEKRNCAYNVHPTALDLLIHCQFRLHREPLPHCIQTQMDRFAVTDQCHLHRLVLLMYACRRRSSTFPYHFKAKYVACRIICSFAGNCSRLLPVILRDDLHTGSLLVSVSWVGEQPIVRRGSLVTLVC